VDVTKIARSAAVGAVEAADRLGSTAGRAVRDTLSGSIAGVRSLTQDARPASPAKPRRRRRKSRAA
jgi:hypothetical protein